MLVIDFSDPNDPFSLIAEALFRSFIEDGSIVIEDQSLDEILLEYKALMAHMQTAEQEFHRIPDHRSILWKRANSEHSEGTPEMAITLYALWIEHSVNGSLVSALQRKGYDLEIIDLIIREVNLRAKITKLWHIAGLDPLEDADVTLVGQIAEARIAFVHYKWAGYDIAADQCR
jgi:hypothetical protein